MRTNPRVRYSSSECCAPGTTLAEANPRVAPERFRRRRVDVLERQSPPIKRPLSRSPRAGPCCAKFGRRLPAAFLARPVGRRAPGGRQDATNFAFLGLIHAALPAPRIIPCGVNPIDTLPIHLLARILRPLFRTPTIWKIWRTITPSICAS